MKSYHKIENAMRELVKKKPFETITVKMICQHAGVSRKTFYSIYQDKYEVIERIVISDVIDELKEMLNLIGDIEFNQPIILEKMYQHFYDERDFYSKAMDIEGKNSLEHCLLYCFEEINLELLKDVKITLLEKEYAAYFFAASQVMLIKKWLLDGMVLTPQEMAENYTKWAVLAMVKNYY